MASFAVRAASLLLVLAVALCFTTTGSAASTSTYNMVAGVNGASYFWQLFSDLMTANPTMSAQVTAAITNDLQTAAGGDVTVTYTGMLINASAMYVKYDAQVSDSSPTQAEVRARVAADAKFPKLTALIAGLSGLSDVSDLVPTSLYVTNPLYPDPNADPSSAGYAVVSSVEYDVVVLFSGEPPAWSTALTSSRSAVSGSIVSAVQALMNSSKLLNEVTVSDTTVLAADANKKTMGSGAGGLVARLHIVSSATTAMTGRYLSTSEYASVLLMLDTTSLSAIFQASSGSTSTVAVEETTSEAALGVKDRCDSSCKGMIGMTAAVVFLALLCVVLTAVAIACPCGSLRSPREAYLHSQKQQQYAVRTDAMEAIEVYGDEEPVESHYPTTVRHNQPVSHEPVVE